MTYFLIGVLAGLIVGVILGSYVATNFDVPNSEYNIEKLKAKKGGSIDIKQAIKDNKPKKKKLFNKLLTKNRK